MRADAGGAAVCRLPVCRARYAALPPSHRCVGCARPLEVAQWAAGNCGDPSCREKQVMRRPLAASQKARADLLASALARRNRSAASRRIPLAERASYKLAILPHIDHRPSALPKKRRDAFEAHLRESIARAREQLLIHKPLPAVSTEGRTSGDAVDARSVAEAKLVGAGCALCRGWCCVGGGDTAYIEVATMVRYLLTFPAHDDDTIVATFLSHVPPRTLTRGCVYQHEHGCTLPRELRSDVCNRFYCGGIDMIRQEYAPGEQLRAYFLHTRNGRLVGDRFVEVKTEGG